MMLVTEQGGTFADGMTVRPETVGRFIDVRPLVVIDPEDREQVERLDAAYKAAIAPDRPGSLVDVMQAALREFANPKPPPLYREHHNRWAPWPVVNECYSSHHAAHECPQCAWEHDHEWVAWIDPRADVVSGPGVPVRCSKCGGRKCDADDCGLMRHGHTHDEAAS